MGCWKISTRIAAVEALTGCGGWLTLQRLSIDALEREEHLLFSAFADDGRTLDQETCEKLKGNEYRGYNKLREIRTTA